jgi:hypothetical protein
MAMNSSKSGNNSVEILQELGKILHACTKILMNLLMNFTKNGNNSVELLHECTKIMQAHAAICTTVGEFCRSSEVVAPNPKLNT